MSITSIPNDVFCRVLNWAGINSGLPRVCKDWNEKYKNLRPQLTSEKLLCDQQKIKTLESKIKESKES